MVSGCAFEGTWRHPSTADFGLLVLTGLLSGLAHYLLIKTFVLAVAVFVASFRYSASARGRADRVFIWDELPTELDWLGILLIVGSSIFIIHRAAKLERFGERLVLRFQCMHATNHQRDIGRRCVHRDKLER